MSTKDISVNLAYRQAGRTKDVKFLLNPDFCIASVLAVDYAFAEATKSKHFWISII
jgi:hypothetical protein